MELAIETALHACSAALIDGGQIVAERHEIIARGHAERLVPLIGELLAEAGVSRADAVTVDVGPGSFTGIRVGLAAAKAFGLAWGAPVAGCTSTELVAAAVLAARADLDGVYVAFDASRGEVYAQRFDRAGAAGDLVARDDRPALEVREVHSRPHEAHRPRKPQGGQVAARRRALVHRQGPRRHRREGLCEL